MEDIAYQSLIKFYELNRTEIMQLQTIVLTQSLAGFFTLLGIIGAVLYNQEKILKNIKSLNKSIAINIFIMFFLILLGFTMTIKGTITKAFQYGIENYAIEEKLQIKTNELVLHEHSQFYEYSSAPSIYKVAETLIPFNIEYNLETYHSSKLFINSFTPFVTIIILGLDLLAVIISALFLKLYLKKWKVSSIQILVFVFVYMLQRI